MIKLCGNSICKPLSIIFNDCLNKGKFPHEWKKANVPVHKKGNKKKLKQNLQQINQDLGLRTPVLTSYLLLPTKYIIV